MVTNWSQTESGRLQRFLGEDEDAYVPSEVLSDEDVASNEEKPTDPWEGIFVGEY